MLYGRREYSIIGIRSIMVSVIILTKNEEKNIKACLETVQWSNEIIVIDDNSEDKTREIAEKIGAKVFTHALENDFAMQRNFGLSKATNEWVLFVDADERVPDTLATEVLYVTSQVLNDTVAYFVRRVDSMWGKKLLFGETGNIKLLRLAKKGSGEWSGSVHEVWKIKGMTAELKHSLLHYPHQTINEFLQEINFYTDIRAEELYKKKTPVFWWDILFYPIGKFIVNYVIKQGFRDGIPGLLSAIFMSLHSFLVRGKLWQMRDKNK